MSQTADHPTSPFPGVDIGKFATWLFLASEIMFFSGLIAAYIVLRNAAGSWPVVSHELNVPLVAANTFILLVSSLTMVRAYAAIQEGDQQGLRRFLVATIVLGVIFLSVQAYEWVALINEGTTASSSLFGSVFFTLTGFHGLHVLGGVIWNVYVTIRAFQGAHTQEDYGGVEIAGLYWHFVDVVWIFLFTIVYLI